jgi:hypothetical protein
MGVTFEYLLDFWRPPPDNDTEIAAEPYMAENANETE